jgi:hypothetical protein
MLLLYKLEEILKKFTNIIYYRKFLIYVKKMQNNHYICGDKIIINLNLNKFLKVQPIS